MASGVSAPVVAEAGNGGDGQHTVTGAGTVGAGHPGHGKDGITFWWTIINGCSGCQPITVSEDNKQT